MFYDWLIMKDMFNKNIYDAVIDFIIYRFNIILYKFKPNEKARDFLKEFVKDKLEFYMRKKIDLIIDQNQLTTTGDYDDGENKEYDFREFRYELYKNSDPILVHLCAFIILYSSNRFIIKEIEYLVKCLLIIAGLEKEYFDNEIRRCDKKLKQPFMMIEGEEKILKDKKKLYEFVRYNILASS